MLNKKTLLILIWVLFSFSLSLYSQSPLTYTSSGTFTVPAGVTSLQAECWGGGGAGGGANGSTLEKRYGGGGSGGTYTKNTTVTVAPGASIDVTVGAGGIGVQGGTGAQGGTSTFASATPVTAIGGNGGVAGLPTPLFSSTKQYGNGGAAPIGTGITYNGGKGADALPSFLSLGSVSGGGGGSAGSGSDGGDGGVNGYGSTAGIAGNGTNPGGDGAAGLSGLLTTGDGNNASAIGGGGGGAISPLLLNSDRTGGAGFRGQVIVTWTCPTYSLTSTTATSTCNNNPSTNSSTITLTSSPAGLPVGTYNVTYTIDPANILTTTTTMTVSTAGTGNFTINSLPIGSTTVKITNLSSGTSPSICSSTINANNTASIIVQSTPTAGTIGTGQTICYNANPAGLSNSTAGTGDGTITYRWETNTNLVTPSWALISGQTIATYGPGALTATTQYRRITISTLNSLACESAATPIVQVNVNPNFTSGAINTTGETICYNGDPGIIGSATASSGGDNSITYKWQANGVDIPSSNTATYDPPSGLTATTTYTRYAKDGACNTSYAASSGSWVVTVRPIFTSGAINTTGETICSNGDPIMIENLTASIGGDNSITYKWQTNGSDIPSSNTATYDPPSGLTANTTYTRYAKDGACNTSFTASTGNWVVTVKPTPEAPAFTTISTPTCGMPLGTFEITNYNNSYLYTPTLTPITPNSNTFYGSEGTYTIKASATGLPSCTSASSTVTISAVGAKIWTGAENSNWFNNGNWSDENGNPTKAPTKDDCIIIKKVSQSPLISDTLNNAYAYSIIVSSGAKLEIAAKSSLTVTNDIDVNTGGTFTLQDSAGLIQVNEADPIKNTNKGSIIVNRNTAPASWNDYTYWSSPTSDIQTLFDFSPNSNPKYFLTYDNIWNYAYPKITKFTAGIGYAITSPINATTTPQVFKNYKFIGMPNNGTITVPFTSGTNPYSGKLVGNPYPSAISADKFILANIHNISGTIYFWTHSQDTANSSNSSNYATYNLCGGTGTASSNTTVGHGNHEIPKFYIASGQGFIVQTKGNITFNNNMRVGITHVNTNPNITNDIADNTNFYRSAPVVAKPLQKHRIWLNLSDSNTNFSQILLGYIESATDNFDLGFDGAYTNNDKFVLYSLIGTDPYTIQAKKLPFTDTDIIPLGFKAAVTGNATISIDKVDGLFSQGQNVFIEDKLTNTTHNLSNSSYMFKSDAGTFNDRFVIKYKDASTLGLDTFKENKNNISITAANHIINVKCDNENIKNIFIYDSLGRLIFENNNVNSFETTISNLTTNQVYIVKTVLANGETYNKKVIY